MIWSQFQTHECIFIRRKMCLKQAHNVQAHNVFLSDAKCVFEINEQAPKTDIVLFFQRKQ